jgi:hypothetical protein
MMNAKFINFDIKSNHKKDNNIVIHDKMCGGKRKKQNPHDQNHLKWIKDQTNLIVNNIIELYN